MQNFNSRSIQFLKYCNTITAGKARWQFSYGFALINSADFLNVNFTNAQIVKPNEKISIGAIGVADGHINFVGDTQKPIATSLDTPKPQTERSGLGLNYVLILCKKSIEIPSSTMIPEKNAKFQLDSS